jgi:integrase
VNRAGHIGTEALTPARIFQIVQAYGEAIGIKIAPHDLRRSFAKLAHKGRAGLEQIQLSLGHESILTTEKYLGVRQDLTDAPCDHLGISFGMAIRTDT